MISVPLLSKSKNFIDPWSQVKPYRQWFMGALLVGLVAVSLHSIDAIGMAYPWCLGSTAVGLFFGFLLGLPNLAKRDDDSAQHLERIATWLTGTLVGVGLTKLEQAPHFVRRMGLYFSRMYPTDGSQAAEVIGASATLYFAITGFLVAYLLTRMSIAPALTNIAALRTDVGPAGGANPDAVASVSEKDGKTSISLDLKNLLNRRALSESEQAYLRQLSQVPLSSLTKKEDLLLWAKAQIFMGDKSRAVEAYKLALRESPIDPQLHYDYAILLASDDGVDDSEVIAELTAAYRSIDSKTDPQLEKHIYKWLVFYYLYQPMPDGYRRAIDIGEEYVNNSKMLPSGHMKMYLAAAYGQQASQIQDQTSIEFKTVRDKSLTYATEAIAMRPELCSTLRMLWDPNRPADRLENDLVVFGKDPGFIKLFSDCGRDSTSDVEDPEENLHPDAVA